MKLFKFLVSLGCFDFSFGLVDFFLLELFFTVMILFFVEVGYGVGLVGMEILEGIQEGRVEVVDFVQG